MIENKIYTSLELQQCSIFTQDYCFMDEPCEVTGTLILKAEARSNKMLRVFFHLEDGRKIITPVFWWQRYLHFPDIDIGTRLRLSYTTNQKDGVFLAKAEVLGE